MEKLEQRIYDELIKRLTEANFGEITITMKSDNAAITITPIAIFNDSPNCVSDIEYFLIDGCEAMLYGCETLEAIAEFLADYDNNVAEHNAEVAKCDAYYDEHIRWMDPSHKNDPGFQETLQCYSDWYKSLHGRRPKITVMNGGFTLE